MRIDFHPDADREFIEAAQRYEARVPELGSRFIDELDGLKDLLLRQPMIGVPVSKTFRRVVFRHFPFSLIYSIEDSLIWVVAVAHQSRRPGYWRKRSD